MKLARRGITLKRSITYAILGLFQETMAYRPACHANTAVLDSLFHAYTAPSWVDSYVIFFFLRNIPFRSIIVD